jgi:hypothetical protein
MSAPSPTGTAVSTDRLLRQQAEASEAVHVQELAAQMEELVRTTAAIGSLTLELGPPPPSPDHLAHDRKLPPPAAACTSWSLRTAMSEREEGRELRHDPLTSAAAEGSCAPRYENQRRRLGGGTQFAADFLLFTDRPTWSSVTGDKVVVADGEQPFDAAEPLPKVRRAPYATCSDKVPLRVWWLTLARVWCLLHARKLAAGWRWTVACEVGRTDSEGWEFAWNWGREWCPEPSFSLGSTTWVRRRKWVAMPPRPAAVSTAYAALPPLAVAGPANGGALPRYTCVVEVTQARGLGSGGPGLPHAAARVRLGPASLAQSAAHWPPSAAPIWAPAAPFGGAADIFRSRHCFTVLPPARPPAGAAALGWLGRVYWQLADRRSGVKVRMRRSGLRTFDDCFTGAKAVDWLTGQHPRGFLGGWPASSRKEGCRVMQTMLDGGWLSPELSGVAPARPAGFIRVHPVSTASRSEGIAQPHGAFVDSPQALYRFTDTAPQEPTDLRTARGEDELIIEIVDARPGQTRWVADANAAAGSSARGSGNMHGSPLPPPTAEAGELLLGQLRYAAVAQRMSCTAQGYAERLLGSAYPLHDSAQPRRRTGGLTLSCRPRPWRASARPAGRLAVRAVRFALAGCSSTVRCLRNSCTGPAVADRRRRPPPRFCTSPAQRRTSWQRRRWDHHEGGWVE